MVVGAVHELSATCVGINFSLSYLQRADKMLAKLSVIASVF